MNQQDLEYFEALLQKERQRLLDELGALGEGLNTTQRESAGDLSAYSFHMADQATDAMEREKGFFIASMGGQTLDQIDQALTRLREGKYGLCRACEREIPRDRLEAVPQAPLCIECQEREERGEAVES